MAASKDTLASRLSHGGAPVQVDSAYSLALRNFIGGPCSKLIVHRHKVIDMFAWRAGPRSRVMMSIAALAGLT